MAVSTNIGVKRIQSYMCDEREEWDAREKRIYEIDDISPTNKHDITQSDFTNDHQPNAKIPVKIMRRDAPWKN